ncbi:hypothetical protein [Bosea vaviloviae]|uniref:Uncharacterized protein n=1 Tax=Bosea vaviloviae TaxID=1526658 RepID=A0A0N1F8F3_9HYPH|nr:hypothetical protein [Bosea vaviloviae]KPH82812.1 hypothetical protein AE618_01720 [Bosea vaviloviae]
MAAQGLFQRCCPSGKGSSAAVAFFAACAWIWTPTSARGDNDVFDVIAQVEAMPSFLPQDVGRLLGTTLSPVDPDGQLSDDLKGSGPILRDGIAITEIVLRRRKQKDGRYLTFMLFRLDGGCVNVATVESRLAPFVRIEAHPDASSRHYFLFKARPSGKLSLGMSEDDCLRWFSFEPPL